MYSLLLTHTPAKIKDKCVLLFVVYERSLKLGCNQNFYLNTNFTETLLLKKQAKLFYKHLYNFF
jgi:hypothetical protein